MKASVRLVDIKSKLNNLNLNPNNSVVIGSGILNALNIRTSKDIDIVVTEDEFARLEQEGHFTKKHKHGRDVLTDDVLEIGTSWGVLGKKQTFKDLYNNSTVVDGMRYITPEFLLRAKKSWIANDEGRPKDFDDVELIEKYLKEQK